MGRNVAYILEFSLVINLAHCITECLLYLHTYDVAYGRLCSGVRPCWLSQFKLNILGCVLGFHFLFCVYTKLFYAESG